ncbi:MAG TPA: DUF2934 domain-containing protein [Bryobacteraceae bacterium]|nr:DUF2934 domain-containing protein [Bryobacteraceae bacterium]
MTSKRVSEKEIVVSPAVPARHKPAASKRVKRSAPIAAAELPVAESSPQAPSREEIARLAYSYWEARGYQSGSPEEDWLRAEQELTAGIAAAATA